MEDSKENAEDGEVPRAKHRASGVRVYGKSIKFLVNHLVITSARVTRTLMFRLLVKGIGPRLKEVLSTQVEVNRGF